MKKCNKCLIEKRLDEFFRDKRHSSGRYSICKSCKQISTYKWREENRDAYNRLAKDWRKRHPRNERVYRLRQVYGLTLEQYEAMVRAQDGKCWICRRDGNSCMNKRLAVDHCHKTKRVRKLLCDNCNKGLGNFQESKQILERAILYLSE